MNWEAERIENALVHQSRQLQEIIELLRLLVDSQRPPSYPATTGIHVKLKQ